jgi:hypothetical protein
MGLLPFGPEMLRSGGHDRLSEPPGRVRERRARPEATFTCLSSRKGQEFAPNAQENKVWEHTWNALPALETNILPRLHISIA